MLLRTIDGARWAFRLAVDCWRASDEPAEWDDEGEPVLLLHGFGGTPRMLRPLGRFLRRALERPTLDVELGIGLGDIRDMAIRVHRLLEERDLSRCDVVGYSMGGLVAAYLVKCLDQGRRIRRVITLGTPYGGVPLVSRWPALLAAWSRAAVQMRTGSPFLDQLLRQPPPDGTCMLSIAGADDTLVPPEVARLEGPGCRSLVVPGIDHGQLLTSRRVFRCVEGLLKIEVQPPGDDEALVRVHAADDLEPLDFGLEHGTADLDVDFLGVGTARQRVRHLEIGLLPQEPVEQSPSTSSGSRH